MSPSRSAGMQPTTGLRWKVESSRRRAKRPLRGEQVNTPEDCPECRTAQPPLGVPLNGPPDRVRVATAELVGPQLARDEHSRDRAPRSRLKRQLQPSGVRREALQQPTEFVLELVQPLLPRRGPE
jgi:hypothetical protein